MRTRSKLIILALSFSLLSAGCTKKAPKDKFVPVSAGEATTVSVEATTQPNLPAQSAAGAPQAARTPSAPAASAPPQRPTATPLPGGVPVTPAPAPSPTPTQNIPLISYRVQPGDTLFSIAQRFGTTPQWIKDYNHLLSDEIAVGQELLVPEPKQPAPTPTPLPQTVEYVVQPGDTLSGIAQKFGTTVDDLIRLNHLSSEAIQVGMVLKVPQVAHPTPAPAYQTYVVQPGDTLIALAERFDTTVDELKSLNNLTSDTLRIGQELRVPQPAQTYATYVVKQGDTLSSIAAAFDVTPEEIARANNLSNQNLLRVGQTLRIPTHTVVPTPRPVRYHVVREGETLTSIAQMYGVTVAQIQAANGLANPNEIYVGQRLQIP